jgi:hypothetical protein
METRTCQEILNSNGFHYINIVDRINNKKAKKPLKINRHQDNKTKKWFSFMYSGTEVLSITRYLKKQNINITFRTSNTLDVYLTKAFCKSANSELLDKCGSCSGVYLDQTGSSFKTRFKEHVSDIM